MLIILFYFLTVIFRSTCLPKNIDFQDKELIDLTYDLDNTSFAFPGSYPYTLTLTHNTTTEAGVWYLNYKYGASEHYGTHMDAPGHFDKTGLLLHQISIDRFIAPAIVVDISSKAEKDPNAVLGVDDLLKWEEQNGRIPDGSVLLVNSGYGKYWTNASAFLGLTEENLERFHKGDKEVPVNFPGCGKEAAEFLVANRSIIGLGVDTTSLDAGNRSKDYPCHVILNSNNIYGLENVANLDKLPPSGITLFAFPIKSKGGSGGPVRILALVDKKKKGNRD